MATDDNNEMLKLVLWLRPKELAALLKLVREDREQFRYLAEYLEAVAELHLDEVQI